MNHLTHIDAELREPKIGWGTEVSLCVEFVVSPTDDLNQNALILYVPAYSFDIGTNQAMTLELADNAHGWLTVNTDIEELRDCTFGDNVTRKLLNFVKAGDWWGMWGELEIIWKAVFSSYVQQ